MTSRAFGSALLITGSETFLTQRLVARRRASARAEQPGAEVRVVHAAQLAQVAVAEALGSTLLSSHTIAVVEDLGSCHPGSVDELVHLASAPPGDLCLTLVHDGGNKGRGVVAQFKKAKVPTETVKAIPTWKLPDFVAREARACGVALVDSAADELVAAVGSDLRSLAAAVTQLAADADGTTVDSALVKRYFAGRAEVSSFAVSDAVMAGQADAAVERLRWALNTGTAPVLITSALASSVRAMGRYLDVRNSVMGSTDLAQHLGITPWKLKNLSAASRNWTTASVAQAMRIIASADAQVKGAASDPEYALERMLLALLALRRR